MNAILYVKITLKDKLENDKFCHHSASCIDIFDYYTTNNVAVKYKSSTVGN